MTFILSLLQTGLIVLALLVPQKANSSVFLPVYTATEAPLLGDRHLYTSFNIKPRYERPSHSKQDIRERIQVELGDTFVRIAECESGMRQFNDDGTVLVSKTGDVGVLQINIKAHLQTALQMGIDIDTLEGNIAYAKYLKEKNGLSPWSASEHCWN